MVIEEIFRNIPIGVERMPPSAREIRIAPISSKERLP
jgi:hypothetical protein